MRIVTNSDKLDFLVRSHKVEVVPSNELLRTCYTHDNYNLVVVDIDQAEGVYSPRIIKEAGVSLPVVGITEDLFYDDDWTNHRAVFIEQGGDYLLRAPVNPREIIACMCALERRFKALRPSIYLCDRALVVNTSLQKVTLNGVELIMTHKERLLFMDLAEHFGQLRTKEQLLSNLYSVEADEAEIKIVDVFICKVRKKMKELHFGLDGVIETVWGRGYRMRDIELENVQEIMQ